MAAIAPCAHYGCGCGHYDHLRNCHSTGTMQQGVSMSSRLRRLFLELKPPQQKHWEAQQLVLQCPPQEVGPFVKAILDQPVPLRWMHILSVEMLGELLRLHPAAVVTHFCNGKNNIAWLFPDDGDVDGAAAFLLKLLWNKQAMGQSPVNEASKFTRLLMKRTQQKDLCKVPACAARNWLVQIWKDVTSTRPNRDLLVRCCVRWIADPYELAERKSPLLEILGEETRGKRAADVEAWIISLIFQEVCRHPMHHSPDLQQLLCLELHQSVLSDLFISAVLVCLWRNLHGFLKSLFPFLPFLPLFFFVVGLKPMILVCEVAITRSANTVHGEISTPRPFRWWKIFDEPVGLHFSLDSSESLRRCISMVFSRTCIICFTSLYASSLFATTWLEDALPFSLDVFGRFGYQQFDYCNTSSIFTPCALQRRSSSSSWCVDAFGSTSGPLVSILSRGSRTRQQAESIGKWELFNCTAHGPDGSDQHFRTRTYVRCILHASTAPRMQRLQYSPWRTISVCTDWPARPSIWPSLATAMAARQSRNATSTITRSTRLDATFGYRHTVRPVGIWQI